MKECKIAKLSRSAQSLNIGTFYRKYISNFGVNWLFIQYIRKKSRPNTFP